MNGIRYETDEQGRRIAIYYGQARHGGLIGVLRARRLLPCADAPAGKHLGQEWVDDVTFPNTNRGWDDCAAFVYGVNAGTHKITDRPDAAALRAIRDSWS